jgi:hypothetical protein
VWCSYGGVIVKKSSADYWAPRISAEWRKSVEGIVRVGLALVAAKAACEHGEFLRLFKGHPEAVADPVPFGEDTAERLMKVASHPVLSDSAHGRSLPQSWRTLYELTKLEDEQILAGIKAGEIGPEMTRSQAAALRVEPIVRPDKPPHEELAAAVKNAVTKFVGHLTTHEQYAYVRQRVESLLQFLSEMEAERVA